MSRPDPALSTSPSKSAKSVAAGEAVLDYVGAQLTELRSLEAALRRAEPDSIHRMRVAARRARAALQEFRPLFEKAALVPLIGELRWLGRELSGARDVQVLRDLLIADLDDVPVELALGPVRARVTGYYAPRLAQAEREVRQLPESARYQRLLEQLTAFVVAAPFAAGATKPAAKVLPRLVARSQRRVRHRMHAAHQAIAPGERDRALHEARKAAKRTRYAAEAVAPVAGRRPKKSAKALKRLQSTLGDQHDSVLAADELRQLGIRAHAEGENGYTYGLLTARHQERAERLTARARREWRRADRRKRTKWMAA